MPAYFHQPENALKRANEFLAVGKNQLALEVLYDVIKSKKHRAWQTIHEPIMLQYLKVCMDMRKSHLAKEGLYQYKNICQQNVKSFENVARAYLKLAKEKTESAREESQQTAVDTEDLNNIHTLAIVFLSATSEENAQDRADRLLLGPWVKFLWESYHQCLDLMRNNSALERLYHDVAQQAFRFCLLYARKTEFRKLCANLRMHLGQMQRHQHHQGTAVNLNNSDSQSMHLETRLAQLDGAISLELWQEAFKAVEDIHSLFLLSKKPPRAQLMASYYGKVSTLFWKCGNVLFHACTLHRLYHLSVETRKNLSQEEMQRMSTRVLLATLSIPISPERADISRFLDMDGIAAEKRFRLASLLGLPSPPTRQSLIKDMVRFNMLQQSAPEVNGLYNWLEVDFHPLQLSDRVTKALNWVGDQAEKQADLQQYVPRLQGNTALRLLQQVAQIYQSIEFGHLASLLPFVDAFQLERYVVDAARHCDLQVRIDHMSRTLSFGSDLNYSSKGSSPVGPSLQEMPTEQIRSQLATVSSSLTMAIRIIKSASILQDREEQHQQAIAACLKNAHWEHQRILARRQAIEERKERLESISCQREKEELEQRDADMHKVRKAEEEHLRQEAREREKERIMQEHKQIKRKTARELLEQTKKTELGAKAFKDFDIEDFEELDQDFIMAKQVEQLEKEKNKLQERLRTQEKKIDHFERAKHLEGIPLVKKAYEEQRVKDMELWGLQQEEMISNMRVEHEKALEHKKRMSRMMEDKEHFVSKITAARSSLYEDTLKTFNERLSEERDKRLEERKKQRKEDRRVAACRQKEEEAQRVREERLKKAREDLERIESEQREKEEREYQAHLCKLEEQECKRRTREQEIEERERRREEEKRASEERPSRPDWTEKAAESRGGWKRRVSAAETDAEWRRPGGDRQQRRQEGREDGTDETEPLRRGNGPRRGARRGAADDWAPRRAEDDDQIDCKLWKQPLRRPGGWRERERFQEDSPGGGSGCGSGCGGDTNQEREERPSEPLRERRSQREEASVWKRGGETDDKGGWRDSPTERRSERRDAKRRYKHEQRSPPREQEEGGSWRRVVDADKGGERREDRDTSKEESVAGGKKRQISNNSKYYRPIYHEVAYTQTAVSYSLNHPHTSEMESTHI